MQTRMRFELILILAVVALATALRFYALDHSSLWSDEGNTWALVQRPFAQIARDAAADIHPPGYYWALKVWTALWGTSAWALRSFSAVAGVLLVAAIAAVAAQFRSTRHRRAFFPALAALVAAVNPFQIYYSQEARMYMLLALEATVLLWATVVMARRGMAEAAHGRQQRVPQVAFVLAGAAGLWTHYSFPIVLAAMGLGFLWTWGQARRSAQPLSLGAFVLLNVLVVLLFLPWLPTALTSVLNWPKGGVEIGLATGVQRTLQTLLFGPLRTVPTPLWPWLTAAVLLPLAGAAALWRQRGSQTVMLTLLLPVGLMFGLGLFSDAFMKFLLVASPAWCLLVAAAPHIVSLERAPDDLAARADTRFGHRGAPGHGRRGGIGGRGAGAARLLHGPRRTRQLPRRGGLHRRGGRSCPGSGAVGRAGSTGGLVVLRSRRAGVGAAGHPPARRCRHCRRVGGRHDRQAHRLCALLGHG
ncbi:MAG: glycosyltransferase family 39 protein [Caldilineaceae bacterium]|nr:glycosyltransferase family 39 protein [Caldilineaceae bacterium]